jgi:hypothetical protein
MYAGRDFDNIEPGEIDIFTIEFTADLPSGRTISIPVFSCTLLETDDGATVDSSPGSRIYGSASITTSSGRTFANQKVQGMIAGNKYALEATVSTNDGCVLKRYSRVYCTAVI